MSASRFRLLTLGRLALVDPRGVEDPSLGTRRRKLALLTVLAVARRPVARDTLVDLFWGDQSERRARHSLSDALSHIRRALGPGSVTTRRAEVELAADAPLAVDVLELAAAASAGRHEEVIRLYGGPFLDAVYVEGSPRWEQWLAQQQAAVDARFVTACLRARQRLAEEGPWAGLVESVEGWESRGALSANPEVAEAAAGIVGLVRAHAHATAPDDARVETPAAAPEGALGEGPVVVTAPSAPPAPPPGRTAGLSLRSAAGEPARVPGGAGNRVRMVAHLARRPLVAGAMVVTALVAGGVALGGASTVRGVFDPSVRARARFDSAQVLLGSAGERGRAVALLEEAVRIDSTFAPASLRLARLYNDGPNTRDRMTAMLTLAARHADRLDEVERHRTIGRYHTLVTGDYASAATAYRKLLDARPNDASAWHSLGMVYQYVGDERRAAEAYARSIQFAARPGVSTWMNLADALYATGDVAGAWRTLDELALAIPGHTGVFLRSAGLAASEGDHAEAERQLRALLTATPEDLRSQSTGHMMLARLYWSMGRHAAGDAAQRRSVEIDVARGAPTEALQGELALAAAAVWLRGDSSAARIRLAAALRRHPIAAMAPLDRPYLDLATTTALTGDARSARGILNEYGRMVPEHVQRQEVGTWHQARGTIALVERRYDEAIAAFERAATPICTVCGMPELGHAYALSGRQDSALAVYRRYASTTSIRKADATEAFHRVRMAQALGGGRSAVGGRRSAVGGRR